MRILVLDNYDSFTYNLVDYLEQTGVVVEVFRNDAIDCKTVIASSYDGVVISPGPDGPEQSGILMELLKVLPNQVPILGICLGFQAIGLHFGAKLQRGNIPVHGKVSTIRIKNDRMYKGHFDELKVCRYHSLVLKDLPGKLEVNALSEDGIPMSFMHRSFPIWGVQYHPEAILTSFGKELISNWVNYAREIGVNSIKAGMEVAC